MIKIMIRSVVLRSSIDGATYGLFCSIVVALLGSSLSTSRSSSTPAQQYFITRPTDVEVVDGTPLVELECQVGNLMGQVQWSKDGFLLGKFTPVFEGTNSIHSLFVYSFIDRLIYFSLFDHSLHSLVR
jgi:hypothetical protein